MEQGLEDLFNQETDDQDEDDQKSKFAWTLHKKALLLLLCLIYIMATIDGTVSAPFFPNVAKDKGVSTTVTGLLFSTHELVAIILCPVFGILVPKFGARTLLMAGILLSGFSHSLFGLTDMLPDPISFATVCFILKATTGLAGAMYSTTVYTVAVEEFPFHVGTVSGLLQCSVGTGVALGPVLGGLMYTAGGFQLPFFAAASAMLMLTVVVYFVVPSSKNRNSRQETKGKTALFQILGIPSMVVLAMCVTVGVGCLLFLVPIFSLFLEKAFQMNAAEAGVLFMVKSACFGLGAPLIGWIGDKTQLYRLMMAGGLVCAGLGYLLLGPAPFLTALFPSRSVALLVVALVIVGLFTAAATVPVMPCMLKTATEHGMAENIGMKATVSAIVNTANYLGGMTPPVSGALYESVGFQWTMSVAALMCFLQSVFLVTFTQCERRLCRPGERETAPGRVYQALRMSEKQ